MVSMLAIGPEVCGFKPSQGQWIFKGDANLQHTFLRRGSKAVGPCCEILQHAKNLFTIWTKILCKSKFIISFTISSCLAARWLLVGFTREPWCSKQESYPVDIIPPTGGWTVGSLVAAVQRCSFTPLTWWSLSSGLSKTQNQPQI
jgi:hypothetical protein